MESHMREHGFLYTCVPFFMFDVGGWWWWWCGGGGGVVASKTPEGRSATFRVHGLGFFFFFFFFPFFDLNCCKISCNILKELSGLVE